MEKNIIKIVLYFGALLLFSSCLKEDELKLPFTTYSPKEIYDGWNISMPENESVDGVVLTKIYKDFHENKDLWQVRSLLVFRNNNLIAESYTKNPDDIVEPAAIWSCTKQVTAILTGIAIDKNIIDGVDDKIEKYLPKETEQNADKAKISIENLLTMRSGIAFENDGFNGGSNKLLMEIPDNSLDFVLSLPIYTEQGKEFHYNDGDPHIISAILQKQTGKTTKDWGYDVLFSKLSIKNYDWIVYKDGITMGAFGILATPREMAKIGHLVLNRGLWNGVQIVSPEWINKMIAPKVSAKDVDYYGTTFGYYWWIDESREIIFMNGHGGQFVFVKPSKNLVVVTTAEPNTQGKHQFLYPKAIEIFDEIDKATQ